MAIDDTLNILSKIYQSLIHGIPNKIRNPNELVEHVNDLYIKSRDDLSSEEIFSVDSILTNTITITIYIEEEFDDQKVRKNMEAKLSIEHHSDDEISKAVWSHNRYHFIYLDKSQNLSISHIYNSDSKYLKQVGTIIIKMLHYCKMYLDELKGTLISPTSNSN